MKWLRRCGTTWSTTRRRAEHRFPLSARRLRSTTPTCARVSSFYLRPYRRRGSGLTRRPPRGDDAGRAALARSNAYLAGKYVDDSHHADFNGLVRGVRNRQRTAIVLDTFGSLRDLANAGLILEEGMPLIAVDGSDDDEDLEGHGTAKYDRGRKWWVVEFDDLGVRYVRAGNRNSVSEFLCVHCRSPLPITTAEAVFMPNAACHSCGPSVLAPFAPPRMAT